MSKGHVFWITGLAGAGKTTFAHSLRDFLKKKNLPVVLLDGDELRAKIFPTAGYERDQRLAAATSYSSLCELISSQGIHVVCSTISMFDDVRSHSKSTIEHYHEVYLKVSYEELERRNQKELYTKSKNTVGKDILIEEPKAPSLVINNDEKSELENNLGILLDYARSSLNLG